MVELGLLPRDLDDSLAMHHYTTFYMHGTSHWLGLDVHDRGSYKVHGKSRDLEPGMAFTVEPGLYVAPEKSEVELRLLEYDLDEWTERRIRLGPARAAVLEAEEKENAETNHPSGANGVLGYWRQDRRRHIGDCGRS